MASISYVRPDSAFVGLSSGILHPSTSQLSAEITSSAITVALDYISGDSSLGVTTVWFKAAITSQEEILFDQIVASHTGLGIPDLKNPSGVPYMVLSGEDNRVQLMGRKGSDLVATTHNFADPTTWYQGSTRINSGLSSSDQLTYTSTHPNWIDLTHGKMLYERAVTAADIAAGSHGWKVNVYVNGTLMSERGAFSSSGGDYSVDYVAGAVSFFSQLQPTDTVDADYSYSIPGTPGSSTWELVPTAGKELEILDSEAQFSADAQLQGALVYGVHGAVEFFAPSMAASNGGPYPDGTPIPLAEKVYDTTLQLIGDARGSYPVIPAMPGPRGHSQAVIGFPFYYGTVNELKSSFGMKLVVRIEGDIPVTGEYSTATVYCLSLDEKHS